MSITLTGFTEFGRMAKSLQNTVVREMDAECRGAAMDWASAAARSAPSDEGFLRNSTSFKKVGAMNYDVICSAGHAAYMEWGTGSKVSVPGEYAEYANQFKGKRGGGDFDDFLLAIYQWVKRKGIAGTYSVKSRRRKGSKKTRDQQDANLAFIIAMKILKVGVKPQPFFFIHKPRIEAGMRERMSKALVRAFRESVDRNIKRA